jgi:hypothetical protein
LKVNGDRFNCPAEIKVRRNNYVLIEAEKEGYENYIKSIDYHLNGTGITDAVGAAIWYIPGVGLMVPGAWDLDETEITVDLYPISAQ